MSDYQHWNVWYYGCHRQLGHRFYLPGGMSLREPRNIPKRFGIPGIEKLLTTTREGEGQFFQEDGWTVFAYPDQSFDRRPGSISAFVAQGVYTVKELIEIALKCFPEVLSRRTTLLQFGNEMLLGGRLLITDFTHVIETLKDGDGVHVPLGHESPLSSFPSKTIQVDLSEILDEPRDPEAEEALRVAYEERLKAQEAVLVQTTGLDFTPPSEETDEATTTSKERIPGPTLKSVRRKGRN